MPKDLGTVLFTNALGDGHVYLGPAADPVAHKPAPAPQLWSRNSLENIALDNHPQRDFVEVQVFREASAHHWRKKKCKF